MKSAKLNGTLCLAARIEGIWQWFMHDQAGFQDFCASTTQFNGITYAYTKDAPDAVKKLGTECWKILMDRFSGSDNLGEVTLSEAPMSTVTRRTALWNK